MVFRSVGLDFDFPDHASPIAGAEGSAALQSNQKLVTRSGATQQNADFDINGYDLIADGDITFGELDIGGTSVININIDSDQNNTFEVQIRLLDDSLNVLTTYDSNDEPDLSGSTIDVGVPVFSDRITINITDTSGGGQNVINGSININVGSATNIDATLQSSIIGIEGPDGDQVEESALNSTIGDADIGLVTYLSRALNSRDIDEFVTRVTDSQGTQIDPLDQSALNTNSNDEVRTRLLGADDGGQLQEVQVESLNTAVSDATFAQVTYLARALNSRSLDEFVSRVTDSSGTQVDPLTDDVTQDTGTDELRTRLFGSDAGGTLQQANAEQFDTTLGTTDVGVATYMARALRDIGQDHMESVVYAEDSGGNAAALNVDGSGKLETTASLTASNVGILDDNDNRIHPLENDVTQDTGTDELRTRVHDSGGTQIDPDRAPDYPTQEQEQDLSSSDLVIGPVSVARAQAVLIAANSEDNNDWSASVEWQDSNGNVTNTESASDIGLSGVQDDYARVVRKGSQVKVTFTNSSGTNNINAFVDAHR